MHGRGVKLVSGREFLRLLFAGGGLFGPAAGLQLMLAEPGFVHSLTEANAQRLL